MTFQTWIVLDVLRHKVQGFLFAGANDIFTWIHICESDTGGYMHMAVDDARHDKLAAEVGNLALISRKTCFVSYIHKFTVLYYQGCCLKIVLICSKNLCVFNNLICFHVVILLCLCLCFIEMKSLNG